MGSLEAWEKYTHGPSHETPQLDFVKSSVTHPGPNIMLHISKSLSLSTIVLNSRDWSEIVWLPEILRFKINLAIGFIRKNSVEYIG